MRFIDLFAGIGGFHYGIDQVVKTDCVYSNEWDKYANSVYRKHYGECDQRDIRTVDAHSIPDHELLCGGFPCQSFSIAGKRGGFSDTRGTLFFEIARILQIKQSRFCLLENVKGLLSHDQGRTFITIINTLDELGYDCQWQVLNSKDFGVPQNRERVFIVGHLRESPRPKIFPIGEDDQLSQGNNEKSQAQIAPVLKATNQYMKSDDQYIKETQKLSDALRVREINGIGVTLKGLGGGMGAKTGLYKVMTGIRRLTPIECERLQGFPDDWTKYGVNGELISDTQRYKMCGNAVTTNVITAIAKRLL